MSLIARPLLLFAAPARAGRIRIVRGETGHCILARYGCALP